MNVTVSLWNIFWRFAQRGRKIQHWHQNFELICKLGDFPTHSNHQRGWGFSSGTYDCFFSVELPPLVRSSLHCSGGGDITLKWRMTLAMARANVHWSWEGKLSNGASLAHHPVGKVATWREALLLKTYDHLGWVWMLSLSWIWNIVSTG